jgi:excisionase family DNA binding protein
MMYEDWITLPELSQQTGISERTLRRRCQDQTLETAHRPIPGRKPLVVVSPESVRKLQAETLKPYPMPPKETLPAKPASRAGNGRMTNPDMRSLLAAWPHSGVSIEKRVFLTLKEAAEFVGLPAAYLKRKIKAEEIPAIVAGGYRIRRSVLEEYNPQR